MYSPLRTPQESIKWFAQINSSTVLRSFTPSEVVSWGSLMPIGESNVEQLRLIHESANPLFSKEVSLTWLRSREGGYTTRTCLQECDALISESEAVSQLMGGWTSKRHFNHPTTDIPLQVHPSHSCVEGRSLLPPVLGCIPI